MIYVLQILDQKFIKVGYSGGAVSERIAQLQTGNPFEISPLLTVAGTLLQEQQLHAALSTALLRAGLPMPPNEWYPGRHPIVVDFLAALRFGCNQALALLDKHDPAVKQWSPVRGVRTPRLAFGKRS